MQKPDFYQIITIALILAIVVTVGGFAYNLSKGKIGKAALSVDVIYDKAKVTIGGKDKGDTPVYSEDIFAKDIKVAINGSRGAYNTEIRPAAGTLAVINRDIGVDDSFSSGQNIWFVKTGGEKAFVSVVSPKTDGVSVIVDGVEVGKTPVRFSTDDLLAQNEEDRYTITFKKDGYESQEVEVQVQKGYTLTIRVDMFLKPLPKEVSTLNGLPEGVKFINFTNVTNSVFTNKQAWAKAINYWLETRGAAVFGNYNVSKFTYFVSDSGDVYNSEGSQISPKDMEFKSDVFIAYLGAEKTDELSKEAQATVSEALGDGVIVTAEGNEYIKIKPTGLGFLRVRKGAGTSNAEVSRVNVGEKFKLLEEKNGWYKIAYDKDKEGWISGAYATKVDAPE